VTTLAEPGKQVRPPEPRRAREFIAPLFLFTVVVAFTGLAGEIGPLWGALVAIVLFGLFWRIDLTRSLVDGAVLVAGGALGFSIFNLAIEGRDVGITWGIAGQASLGIALFGFIAGWVVLRNSPGLKPTTLVLSGAAWGGGAYVALLTAVAVGLVDKIRVGQDQELTIALFVAVTVAAGVLGATANVSFWSTLPAPFGVGFVFLMTVLAWNEIGFSVVEIWTQITRIGEFIGNFWPPDFTWPKSPGQPETFNMGGALIETFQIAIVGATVGSLLAAPLSFYASRPTTPNNTVYWISKSFLSVIRTIPDLFWAVMFATAVGFGRPIAGALAMIMFTLAIMAKLLSETVDAIDLGPLEAAKAAGATHNQIIMRAAFPQVAPNYVAYALYMFELNIRASVVIGFVGAGGIGRLLDERRQFFQWDQVMSIVLVIFASVLIIEAFSIFVRKRLV
jgi:phosphonate transport system permease protein